MKKLLVLCSLVVMLIGGMAFNASAAPLTGDIGFSGSGLPNNTNLTLATSTGFTGMQTLGSPAPTGSFLGVGTGTAVTVNNITFSPLSSFSSVSPWWTFTSGANTFVLNAMTETYLNQVSPSFLNVAGTGTLTENGANATPYYWSFTETVSTSGNSVTAGISNSNVPPVTAPEPATLLLLGLGLFGVGAIGRKVKK